MDEKGLSNILQALNVVHSPESSRETRFSAQQLLDELKDLYSSPSVAIQLLELNEQALSSLGCKLDIHIVQHFSLSLFETSVGMNWKSFSNKEKESVTSFLCKISLEDNNLLSVHFVRSKLASVFIEIAKRDWYNTWREEFDSFLQSLWSLSLQHRQLSSLILRGIMEDLYQYDDPVASLRSHILFNALISILSSSSTLHKLYPSGLPYSVTIPSNNEGWLIRWGNALESQDDALECLKCFKSCLSWVATDSIREANIVSHICQILVQGPIFLKTHAIDCIYICVTRTMEIDDPLWEIVEEMLSPSSLYTLHQVYTATSESINIKTLSSTTPEYILLKKLSETIVALGQYNYLDSNRRKCIKLTSLDTYSLLVLEIMKHPSLLISAISQHFWVLALRDPIISKHEKFQIVYPELLSIASERLLRFEDAVVELIPESATAKYLQEDVEGVSAVHSFCGNFRRFMFDIVRLTVSITPIESLNWIQNRFQSTVLGNMEDIQSQTEFFSKTSPLYLTMDVGFSTIEAFLHGVTRWNENTSDDPATYEIILQNLFLWCKQLVEINFKDPMLITRLISVLVLFTSILARENTTLLGVVLEKIISAVTYDNTSASYGFSDVQKINEMRSRCCFELVRLGELMPNPLMNIFDQLQSIIDQLDNATTLTGSEIVMLKTFLFVITQFSDVNIEVKNEYFEKLVGPVVKTWLDVQPPVNSPMEFLNHIGFPQMAEYLSAKYPYNADYTQFELDADAASYQSNLETGRKWLWPIKCLGRFCEATCSNKHIHPSEFEGQKNLWQVILPNVVPNLLKLVEQLHCCYEPSFISGLGMHNSSILQKSIVERFWLHGVSQISKNQFLEESYKMDVSANKLIHSFGHFLRRLREYCYYAIASFMRLGQAFFCVPGLSKQFLTAFFSHAAGLSLHQWTSMVNVVIKPYCVNCPAELRDECLLPLLPALLSELDHKLVSEWRRINDRGLLVEEDAEETGEDDDLSEEMIEESLLRHLTYATAKLITETFLQITPTQSRSNVSSSLIGKETVEGPVKLSEYVLDNAIICEPLLCTLCHLLVIHDSRTVGLVVNAFLAITPLLVSEQAHSLVREFICQQVFQSVILAIHDPYFESMQSDFIRLACIILSYSQGITDSAFQLLASIPALANQENLVPAFFNKFREASTLKIQKALLTRLLNSGRIVPRTDRRAVNAAILDVSAKEMLKRFEKSVSLQDEQKNDVLSRDEDTGLANLFE